MIIPIVYLNMISKKYINGDSLLNPIENSQSVGSILGKTLFN